jgi:hypothetical protein
MVALACFSCFKIDVQKTFLLNLDVMKDKDSFFFSKTTGNWHCLPIVDPNSPNRPIDQASICHTGLAICSLLKE